ncbi:MAG: aldo/keto reductase [Alphaproteobacteria bacterium]|jgi:diketogulonate reductase-like aldo/keto reductase|nr:aldo/keto reductase [Alphaproteobacteria bacterium]
MYYTLSNGVKIPKLGFGTWQSSNEDAYTSTKIALETGYRHIDTAAIYCNEEGVGKAVKEFLNTNKSVKREDLFITTKLWNDSHGYYLAHKAFKESLKKLQLDYVDLYLIHWPNPIRIRNHWEESNADAYKAMEEMNKDGLARAIGVSNFHPRHLDTLLKTAKIIPHANQIFYNPSDMQSDVVDYNNKHNILTQAYSPLGTGRIFDIKELKTIAEKCQKTVAQVVLNWCLEKGVNPLPKSVHGERIIENFNIFDFKLSAEDIALIDGLKGKSGSAKNPDVVEF